MHGIKTYNLITFSWRAWKAYLEKDDRCNLDSYHPCLSVTRQSFRDTQTLNCSNWGSTSTFFRGYGWSTWRSLFPPLSDVWVLVLNASRPPVLLPLLLLITILHIQSYIHTSTYIHTSIYTYTSTCIHTSTHIYTPTYVYTSTYIYTYTHRLTYTL